MPFRTRVFAAGGCHLYFAPEVTFLSWADSYEWPHGASAADLRRDTQSRTIKSKGGSGKMRAARSSRPEAALNPINSLARVLT
jgi:hypothetical protein